MNSGSGDTRAVCMKAFSELGLGRSLADVALRPRKKGTPLRHLAGAQTITAALLLGYNAGTAARFSFLLSIPIILGAMVFMSAAWLGGESQTVPLLQLLVAMVVAGVSAYATIALFLGLLDRIGLMPFVIYRLVLGGALVLVIFLA